MRPSETREITAQMQRDIQSLLASDDAERTIIVDGESMVIRNRPFAGAVMSADDPAGALLATSYEPCTTRPTNYPEGLPFLPNVPAGVIAIHGGYSIQWFFADGGDALMAEVEAQLIADGWEEDLDADGEPEAMIQLGIKSSEWKKGKADRTLMLAGPMLQLI